ncbi:hypothetical protein K439DRAFT_1640354 [Ramaria rubella]|nr:hypothetical protein K439DRAFT_1640354 [Ramaria rubella]
MYSGPLTGESNPCICSTVTYSMVSACAECQGRLFEKWSQWITNCSSSDVEISTYNQDTIFSPGFIPAWAYLDVTKEDTWNATLAENNQTAEASEPPPETSTNFGTASPTGPPIVPATETFTSPFTDSLSPTDAALPTPAASSEASDNKVTSQAGAIAGGTIGAVIGIVIIAAGAVYCRRRNRRFSDISGPKQQSEKLTSVSPKPVEPIVAMPAPIPDRTAPLMLQSDPPKLYDPDDPSTFPATPSPLIYGHTNPSTSRPQLVPPNMETYPIDSSFNRNIWPINTQGVAPQV